MDQQQDQHPPMPGDDELAKALQGGLQFEETPVNGDNKQGGQPAPADGGGAADAPSLTNAPDPLATPPAADKPAEDKPAGAPADDPIIKHSHEKPSNPTTGNADLDKIKTSALEELRPLVGKLNLPADEKFDTLLLIIRSTDDQTLLDEAHDAAKGITDDTKRAQALLDIIKEIDYFSTKR